MAKRLLKAAIVGTAAVVVGGCCSMTMTRQYNLPEVPEWYVTSVAPEPTAEDFFFTGKSGPQSSEEAARMKAVALARAEVAATIETLVDWYYLNQTDFAVLPVPKRKELLRLQGVTEDARARLITTVKRSAQMARQQSICIETIIGERTGIWPWCSPQVEVVAYNAVALVTVTRDKMAHIDEMQREKDKIEVRNPVVIAEELWNSDHRQAAIDELKKVYVREPENFEVLDRLSFYEQEAGQTADAIQHVTILINHEATPHGIHARAEARLKALNALQKSKTTDKLIDAVAE